MMRLMPLLLAALLITLTVHAEDSSLPSDAPYIYYYSDILNGVVIERADGTDSRVIGQGVMEFPTENVGNFAWSPSGRWLAWSLISYIYSPSYGIGYATSIDGRSAPVVNQFACVENLVWHPTRDLLLLVGSVRQVDGRCDALLDTYWYIDPETNTLLSSVTIEAYIYEYPSTLYWQNDTVRFQSVRYRYGDAVYLDYVVTLHTDGRVEITPFKQRADLSEPASVTIPGLADRRMTDGLRRGSAYTIRDFNPDLTFEPPVNSSGAGPHVAWSWHEDGNWLFIVYRANFIDSPGRGRISIYQPDTETYRELGVSPVDWLPDYVPLDELQAGQSTSVLLSPLYYERPNSSDFGYSNIVNLPSHAMMTCVPPHPMRTDEVGVLELWSYDLSSGERLDTLFTLSNIQECPLRQAIEMRVVTFAISPDERYLALTPALKRENYTFVYDITTAELIGAVNFEGGLLSFSPDSTILYTGGRFANAAWRIEDLLSQQR
jgi:hypothetical protein